MNVWVLVHCAWGDTIEGQFVVVVVADVAVTVVRNFVCFLGALRLLGRRFIGRIVFRVPWVFHCELRSLGERSTLSASLSSPELPGLAFIASRYFETKSKYALWEVGLAMSFLAIRSSTQAPPSVVEAPTLRVWSGTSLVTLSAWSSTSL